MKKLKQTLKLLMLITVLIGFGLTAVSQNQKTITNYQLKQIRLSENQAKSDRVKVTELNKAVDTLNKIVRLKDIRLNNCDTIQQLQYEKIEMQNTLINIRNEKIELFGTEKKALKKQVRKRTLFFIGSAVLNTIFIIKTIQ